MTRFALLQSFSIAGALILQGACSKGAENASLKQKNQPVLEEQAHYGPFEEGEASNSCVAFQLNPLNPVTEIAINMEEKAFTGGPKGGSIELHKGDVVFHMGESMVAVVDLTDHGHAHVDSQITEKEFKEKFARAHITKESLSDLRKKCTNWLDQHHKVVQAGLIFSRPQRHGPTLRIRLSAYSFQPASPL